MQDINTGRQAKARDSMPEGGPRDLTLSESLASKLLDIECTPEEDWTDVEDPDKLGKAHLEELTSEIEDDVNS